MNVLKNILTDLRSTAGNRAIFDPSKLNDPITMKTEWTPAKGGGTSFQTHKLVEADYNRLEFRVSTAAKLFYSAFILVGMVMIGILVFRFLSGRFQIDMVAIILLSTGLLFSGAGGCLLYFGTAPIVFDKIKGCFWRGRKEPVNPYGQNALKQFTRLEDIHALQLVSEYCRGDKSSFYSYELNLVLKNGKRINVVDHGNQDALREDANTLSAFLEKPVWDATNLN